MTRSRERYGILGAMLGMVVGAMVVFASLAGGQALRLGTPAPEIAGAPWVNSPPLTTAVLRGRVLFVEFWTYG
jgi:hypothetical protein